ncbi:MAG TPA: hypothetical protein VNQ90_15490 [Chthoniobacteraceae bacterium]|nr:hypothetical protein [Chthoniobacteraceae bacterium]
MSKYIDAVGKFRCKVTEPEAGWLGESEKGTPYIQIPVVVDEEGSDQNGNTGVYYAYLSDKTIDRTVKDLNEVFGWDGDLNALAGGQQTFAGMECSIVTESDEYEGKEKIKIKFLNSPNRAAERLSQDKVSSLIARLNSRTKAVAKAAGSAAPAKPAAKTPQKPAPEKVDAPF